MKTVQDAASMYTRKSFTAFLEERPNCDEKWVLGIIRASSPKDITEALASLSSYGNKKRFEFLEKNCG
jgi:hypothetical protein